MNAPRLAGHGVLLGGKSGDAVHVAIMQWQLKRVSASFAAFSAKLTPPLLFAVGPSVPGASGCQMSCVLEFLALVSAVGGLPLVFGDRRVL